MSCSKRQPPRGEGSSDSTPKAPNPDFWSLLKGPRRIPLVMGIVNVTPDSFYEVSRFSARQAADEALRLFDEGADLIDIGGQSTRPGSDAVSLEEELSRVVPVFEALSGRAAGPLSVDTDKAPVARQCLAAGAAVLNDVSALRNDPAMAETAKAAQALILMHHGPSYSPKTMQRSPRYDDVVREAKAFLAGQRDAFARAGGEAERVLFDPGIGFAKDLAHNLSLLKHAQEFAELGPVVLGVSRKSFLGRISPDAGPSERLEGSLAVACWAALRGVSVLRVHDVRATRKALAALGAVLEAA